MEYIKKINLDKIRNAAEDAINQAKPKSEVEARIYEALSHKNWGSSSTLMNEISRDSFDYERYSTITRIIWESLSNQRPAAWRVIFKALTLLEHLVKNGSERCVDDARNHSHVLRALFNFNYYEGATDRGIGIREKSKQIVELVGDDERVREERTKAKQLREKFGGNLGGVSSSGASNGGSSYAGYGNDDFGGYNGGGSSYGNSGIGASASTGFSGRYNDTNNETSGTADMADTATPTFAAVPEKKKKKSKKSKKKKEKPVVLEDDDAAQVSAPAPAPEIDLLAMDDPTPVVEHNDASFDAFQSAPTSQPSTTDSFDAFGSSLEQAKPNSFDAFSGAGSTQQNQQPQFDAFHSSAPVLGSTSQTSNTFDAFGANNNSNNVNNMFGNMSMNNMPMNNMTGFQNSNNQSSIMGGNRGMKTNVADEDDFGDFADGNASKNTNKSDPLKSLISLDGLTKNAKNEDKTKEPIVFNQAAQNYVQNKEQITKSGASKVSVDLAFSGVDGLHKTPNYSQSQTTTYNNQSSTPMMMNNGMMSGMNNMSSNSMSMGMQNSNNMNGFGNNNNMAMNSMMGGNNNANNMMGGNSMNNMMGGNSMNNMMGGNNMNNMMGGNNMNNNMMGGNNMNNMMGGQQKKNMMGNMMGQGQQGSNMMGGQPMGGGW